MMLNKITVKANQAAQQAIEAINDVSQGFTQARQEFQDRALDPSWSRGGIVDAGACYGAYVASSAKFVMKYAVGRGYKATDAVPVAPKTLVKQHGLLGLALRVPLGKLGALCAINPQNNLAVRLADVAMACLRFVLISLSESMIVTMAYIIATGLQLAYDGACGAMAAAKRAEAFVRQSRATGRP